MGHHPKCETDPNGFLSQNHQTKEIPAAAGPLPEIWECGLRQDENDVQKIKQILTIFNKKYIHLIFILH